MSAIDLFAAAMGAFALLAIILLPYYQREVRSDVPENAISDLLRAEELSQVETVEKRKALEAKRSAMARNVSSIKSDAQELLERLRAAEALLDEKSATETPPPATPTPEEEDKPAPRKEEAPQQFAFLGMNTAADDIVVAMDLNRCLGGHEVAVKRAVERILQSLRENHAVRVVGFQKTDAGTQTYSWPPGPGLKNVIGNRDAAITYAKGLTDRFGGSSSMLDAFDELLAGPGEAIFLVSDGLPNPRANEGLSLERLAREITRRNAGQKEIHAVVVGNYFDYRGTVEFMEALSAANGGQFMALASTSEGVCD